MPTWPASLPSPMLGLTRAPRDNRLRTQMDAGEASVRRRYTKHVTDTGTPMLLTGAQLVTFEAFAETELGGYTLRFDWLDPLDDAAVALRFVEVPQWQLVKPDPVPANRLWQADLKLEIV